MLGVYGERMKRWTHRAYFCILSTRFEWENIHKQYKDEQPCQCSPHPERLRVKRRAWNPWIKVRMENPKCLLSRPESEKWRRKRWQEMTESGAGLWMLIAPKRRRVRRRAWCLWIENEKGYTMDSCFVGNKQYLKEISSFEAADGVFLEGRFWWRAPPLGRHVVIWRWERHLLNRISKFFLQWYVQVGCLHE